MRRITLAALAAFALLLVWSLPAAAHANLASSDPADGAELARAPSQVAVAFTEAPDPDLSKVLVLNAAGQQVQSGPATAGTAPRSLVVPLQGDLPDGVYTVSWQVVSEADGHLTANAFSFGVGVAPGASTSPVQPATPSPSVLSIVGRALLYAGIVTAIGTAFAGLWTIGAGMRGRRWLAIAAGVSIAVGAVCMVVAERSTVGVTLRDLLSSSAGEDYVWLLAAAAAALACAVIAGVTRTWAGLALLGAAGIATALVRTLGGHAAAATPAWPQEALQVTHITAASIWVGGFVPVLLLLWAWRSTRANVDGSSSVPPADEASRFSRAAGWAVLVLVITGLLRAMNEAGGLGKVLDMLFDTSYGTTLLIKVAIVAGMIALGWLNRRRSIPRLRSGDGMLARVMSIEAVAAITVLTVTATLTGLNPEPPASSHPSGPASVSASASDFATTMRVELRATPGTPGRNTFDVDVRDFDSDEPLAATAVALRFEAVGRPDVQPSQLDLTEHGSGSWGGIGSEMSLAGVWDVIALVQTGARATDVPLTLVTRAPGGQHVNVTSEAGLPDITTITLASGSQIQAYADPGAAGANEVHVTAFDASGQELSLQDLLVIATPPEGDPRALDATRLTPGHFSAAADLTAGEWRFDLVATSKDGPVLQAWFDQTIGQEPT
jgi:copper transport protein